MEVLSVTRLVIPRNGQAELIFTGNLQEIYRKTLILNGKAIWFPVAFPLNQSVGIRDVIVSGFNHQDWLIWIHLVTNNSWYVGIKFIADRLEHSVLAD